MASHTLAVYVNAKSLTLTAGLQKHMEGLTNDVERSNETVFTSLPFLFIYNMKVAMHVQF